MKRKGWVLLLGLMACGENSPSFFRDQLLYSDTFTILPGRIRALDWELDQGDELHIDVFSSAPLSSVAFIQGDAAWTNYLQKQVYESYQSFLIKDALTVQWKVVLNRRDFYYLLLENHSEQTVTVTVRVRY